MECFHLKVSQIFTSFSKQYRQNLAYKASLYAKNKLK